MTTPMNIVWVSANTFGLELLKTAAALSDVSIQAVITLSEVATTRMYDGVPARAWEDVGIPVVRTERLDEDLDVVRRLAPSLLIVAGWRQVLSEGLLTLPSAGVVGFHPTLLPHGRGSAPIIHSILEGPHESGVTLFYLNQGVDTGDIIGQEPFCIEESDYASDVYTKVIGAGRVLVEKYVPLLAQGRAPRVPQDVAHATVYPRRGLRDNELLPEDSWETKRRKVRALAPPYDGAFLLRDGQKVIIRTIEELEETYA
ncbi:MAG: formyltransferase family protein [Candidatus Paceibacterota bacterium]|jgi:methionyl-tRNA formyltransferase